MQNNANFDEHTELDVSLQFKEITRRCFSRQTFFILYSSACSAFLLLLFLFSKSRRFICIEVMVENAAVIWKPLEAQ